MLIYIAGIANVPTGSLGTESEVVVVVGDRHDARTRCISWRAAPGTTQCTSGAVHKQLGGVWPATGVSEVSQLEVTVELVRA